MELSIYMQVMLMVIFDVSDRQQAPPSLTFTSPLAKLNSAID
jgi:hypothetical protein